MLQLVHVTVDCQANPVFRSFLFFFVLMLVPLTPRGSSPHRAGRDCLGWSPPQSLASPAGRQAVDEKCA